MTLKRAALLATIASAAGAACDSGDPAGASIDCGKYGAVGTSQCPQEASTCPIVNDAFCEGQAATLDCNNLEGGRPVEVCGVPLAEPKVANQLIELERATDVKEFSGSGPPVLDCWREGSFPPPPDMSQAVMMTGIAKIFKNGCESDGVVIEVFTVKRTGGSDDGAPDQMVGTATTPAVCDMTNAVAEDVDQCTDSRWECTFQIAGIPTETELLVKTSGPKWKTIYEYNVFLRNTDVMNVQATKDVRALATEDYPVIAQAAIGRPITPGRGAIAGEVHDCGDVRLINAVVDIDKPRAELTYFGNSEDDPLPDLDAKATGRTALYSALDITPGPVTVASAGVLGGELLGVGFYKVQVFADSVTSITFRGLRPYQVPGQ